MITFQTFISEEKETLELTEEDIDSMVNNLKWEDIEDLYSEDEFEEEVNEAISAVERMRKSQRMRARKVILAIQRKIKLKRASPIPVLKRRSMIAARKLITGKLLKTRDKQDLSPAEKNMIELRAKKILKVYKNLPQKLLPKIRELERSRLKNKK